jgi:hypothetical protein
VQCRRSWLRRLRSRKLNIVDEFTHECLAIRIARRLKAVDVIELLSDLFILRRVPAHIRSDNGPEFIAGAVRGWIAVAVLLERRKRHIPGFAGLLIHGGMMAHGRRERKAPRGGGANTGEFRSQAIPPTGIQEKAPAGWGRG